MKVEYRANNSGGSWWLDDDWRALEDAGWTVYWGGRYWCHSDAPRIREVPEDRDEPCESPEDCPGHRCFDSADDVAGRWLGSLAQGAEIEVDDPAEAIRSFEQATGEDASAQGCNCCGPPHSFRWDGGYASGTDVLAHLYDDVPSSMREAVERLNP